MTKVHFLKALSIFFLFIGLTQSCQLFDPCASTVCENGGTCNDGKCECADGYEGEDCSTRLTIQQRLDSGKETPLQLTQKGVKLDSLYGKKYAGGIIFFVNTEPSKYPKFSGEGLVTTPIDYGNFTPWGCAGHITGATGREVGTGKTNTETILAANCQNLPASSKLVNDLVLNGYDDWFLPSIDEVDLMYYNLHKKGHSNFLSNIQRYQSSTEHDANHFTLRLFKKDTIAPVHKISGDDIRPTREF